VIHTKIVQIQSRSLALIDPRNEIGYDAGTS